MKKILAFIIILPMISFGQKQGNIWYFGNLAGMDFNSGSPVTLNNGQMAAEEGTSIICDSTGALLFYTNGVTIWNKNHQIMLNGDSLMGGSSSTQAALILPQPGSSRYFYVFTTDDFQHNLANGFRYSVVDICSDNGLGAVISNMKNTLVLYPVAEKLTAVKHGNGMDYWVIVHEFYSDAFYAYHLNAFGISDTVISHVGSYHPPIANVGSALGQLKASPDGQKLAIVTGNCNPCIAEYLDFDKNTGVVSNPVSVSTNTFWNYYGVSFSPDNSKLYITSVLNGNGIYQYDLTAGAGNPSSVIASQTEITGTAGSYNFLALQLGPDGKIYSTRSPFGGFPFLGVINDPNNVGMSCNYLDAAINLNGHFSNYGFPNFVDSYDYNNSIFNCLTGIEEESFNASTIIFPNPSHGSFIITFKKTLVKGKVTISNILGENIFAESISNESKKEINFRNMSSGIYFVKLFDGEKNYCKKIILE